MNPETIRTVGQIRQDFYQSFADVIGLPVHTTKGNPQSSSMPKISWTDDNHRPNYVCLYAHIAPDVMLPDRPLILRVGVNKGLGVDAKKQIKSSPTSHSKLLQFELTVLPNEALDFAPWIVNLFQAHKQRYDIISSPPHPLSCNTLDELLTHGAWTQQATLCLSNIDWSQTAQDATNLSRGDDS